MKDQHLAFSELPQIGFPLISLSPDFCVRPRKDVSDRLLLYSLFFFFQQCLVLS